MSSLKGKGKGKGKGKSADFLQNMLNAADDPLSDLDQFDQDFEVNDDEEGEEGEEIDKESIDEFMDDGDYIQDSEITELLNKTTENRKKLRTGDANEMAQDMEDFDANLALTTGIGKVNKQTKKRLMAGETRLPPQVKQRLGEANGLYIQKEYGAAIDILQDIITEHPNAHQAWNTLGLVHEELGNKSKSLQLRMVAAHMCQEASLWKELGQKSVENDAIKQAIYCFSKALTIESADVDALWDRSFLYKQLGRNKEAAQGFQTLLLLLPHHFKVINELAQLYRAEGKTKEAIQLYENAIVYHNDNEDEDDDDDDEEDEEDEFLDKLGYAEINMLSELYLMQNDYRRSLDTIKTGLRHIQHRQNETWWQDTDNDDEYFSDDQARTEFPIELRIRMGVCRVYLGKVDLATKHFGYLLKYPPTTYPDLHQDIAYAYFDRRHYDLALNVFQKIIDAAQEVDVDILIRMGDCHREVGELEAAIVFYVNVLDEYPDNLDVMMSLATVYEEQGKEEQALELVDYVMKKNREVRRQKKSEMENSVTQETSTNKDGSNKTRKPRSAVSFFDESQYTTQAEFYRARRAAKLKEFEEKTFQIEGIFQKLEELDEAIGPCLVNADRSLIRDYIRASQEAWDDFRSTTAFYPASKGMRYEGFYALRRKRITGIDSVEREAREMANRLRVRVKTENGSEVIVDEEEEEEEREIKDEEERENQLRSANHFRNITFNKWLRFVVRYAYMLALSKRTVECCEVLKRAAEANVFYQHIDRMTIIKVALLGCGLVSNNDAVVMEGIRWICNYYRFINDPFPLYITVLENGLSDNFSSNTPSMKYLARNIRLIDVLIASKRKGSSSEDDQPGLDEIKELDDAILAMNVEPSSVSDQNMNRFYSVPNGVDPKGLQELGIKLPEKPSPYLLSSFGHLLTLSKNHLGASLFFMRAYGINPTDPVNTLCLGLSLIYTAMQRKSDNRHMQIIQGMMFIKEYTKLVGYNQESEYNMARVFHTLGLTHLAVPHYENALCLPSKKNEGLVEPKSLEDVYLWPVGDEAEEGEEDDDDDDDEGDDTDLSREAAYNLHLIYVNSGAMTLAQIVLLKYCTI